MTKSRVWLVAAVVGVVAVASAGCGFSRDSGPTGPSEVLSSEATPTVEGDGEEAGGVHSSVTVVIGKVPTRPVTGTATLGYGAWTSWSTNPHNGIDYSASLWTPIGAVGAGTVYSYTKPNATRFGSIKPDGAGPAIWIRHTLLDGSPIYVLYGHTASSWTDYSKKTVVGGKTVFTFSCTYSVIPSGRTVTAGETIGYTAPFYNGGALKTHLHLSVFKPARLGTGQYATPPSSGWGYSAAVTSQGQYIDPELFFRTYKLR